MTKQHILLLFGTAAAALTLLCTGCGKSGIDERHSGEISQFIDDTILTTTAVTTTATEETSTTTTERQPVLEEKPASEKKMEVECILQYPELPTGCEITSLTMLLQYYGFDVDKETMVDDYLPCSFDSEKYTLDDAYIGSPYDSNGYGCYASVLEKTANDYLKDEKSELKAMDVTGSSQEEILTYISSGYPVVMWETVWLSPGEETYGWTTEDGREVVWNNMEHCVLLRGYDLENNIAYVCDPERGDVEYELDRYFDIYDSMHQRALIIY